MSGAPVSYAEVAFPFETKFAIGEGRVRLFCAMDKSVFGVSYYVSDDGRETMGQALAWDHVGHFGGPDSSYPTMDLMPPPGLAEAEYGRLQDAIADAQTRLDEHPDAPAEWRAIDEKKIVALRKQAEALEAIFRADVEPVA